jgi:hypothetical protein
MNFSVLEYARYANNNAMVAITNVMMSKIITNILTRQKEKQTGY